MPKDAIFRLASMSKPIGAVAVMMMIEEGKVRLNDPVSRFIPEFKQARVAVPKPGAAPAGRGRGGPPPEVDLVDARPITVRDLLTHTSGLMSSGPGQSTAPEAARQRTPQDTLATYMPAWARCRSTFSRARGGVTAASTASTCSAASSRSRPG